MFSGCHNQQFYHTYDNRIAKHTILSHIAAGAPRPSWIDDVDISCYIFFVDYSRDVKWVTIAEMTDANIINTLCEFSIIFPTLYFVKILSRNFSAERCSVML